MLLKTWFCCQERFTCLGWHWDRVPLSNLGRPWTWDTFASSSQVLWWQACATTLSENLVFEQIMTFYSASKVLLLGKIETVEFSQGWYQIYRIDLCFVSCLSVSVVLRMKPKISLLLHKHSVTGQHPCAGPLDRNSHWNVFHNSHF